MYNLKPGVKMSWRLSREIYESEIMCVVVIKDMNKGFM